MEYAYEQTNTPENVVSISNEKAKLGWRLLSVVMNGYGQFNLFYERQPIVIHDDPPM